MGVEAQSSALNIIKDSIVCQVSEGIRQITGGGVGRGAVSRPLLVVLLFFRGGFGLGCGLDLYLLRLGLFRLGNGQVEYPILEAGLGLIGD